MWNSSFLLIFLVGVCLAAYDNELNCLVCRALIYEAEKSISQVDPKKVIDIGGRVQSDGSINSKKKVYRRSGVHLDELLESVCSKFEDYVHGVWKDSGVRAVIPIMIDGKMNPEFSAFEVKQDGELNKGIENYCSSIVDEEEESLLEVLSVEREDAQSEFCSRKTNICQHYTHSEL